MNSTTTYSVQPVQRGTDSNHYTLAIMNSEGEIVRGSFRSEERAAEVCAQMNARAAALDFLTDAVHATTTVYTRLVGNSHVRLYVILPDERACQARPHDAPCRLMRIVDITYYVARALDEHGSLGKGIRRGGGGYSKELDVYTALRRLLDQPDGQEFLERAVIS